MSCVSGVVLSVSVLETPAEGADDAELPQIKAINQWLEETPSLTVGPLRPLSDHFGGNKHPQILTYGAGLNHLDEDAFARFVLSQLWHEPGNVVLIINPEEGLARVFRPT